MEYVRLHQGSAVVIQIDHESPNVLHLDRDASIVITPVDRNTYVVSRGRLRLGDIIFHDDPHQWGWRYYPRSPRLRPSRKLHSNALSTLRGRLIPDIVLPHTASSFSA